MELIKTVKVDLTTKEKETLELTNAIIDKICEDCGCVDCPLKNICDKCMGDSLPFIINEIKEELIDRGI